MKLDFLMQVAPEIANNRVNIPAIGRIPGHGSCVLISPGVLLTSSNNIQSASHAATLSALFFEFGKKKVTKVKLLPDKLFFTSVYPDYLNYCLIACETNHLYNVRPVKLPLVSSEWRYLKDGDSILIVQHPLPIIDNRSQDNQNDFNNNTINLPNEQKVFAKIQKSENELYYFHVLPGFYYFGSPCFTSDGQFVGLCSQFLNEDKLCNRMVSISLIAKHLFANEKIGLIKESPEFHDIWTTYYDESQSDRIYSILTNFTYQEAQKPTLEKLCLMAQKNDYIPTLYEYNGIAIIIKGITVYMEDLNFVESAVKVLWILSSSDNKIKDCLLSNNIISVIQTIIETHNVESLNSYIIVILFNLSVNINFIGDWIFHLVPKIISMLKLSPQLVLIQKFGIGLFYHISRKGLHECKYLLSSGAVQHTLEFIDILKSNEFVVEYGSQLLNTLLLHPSLQANSIFYACIDLFIQLIELHKNNMHIVYYYNNSLWSMSNCIKNRIKLLRHPLGLKIIQESQDVITKYSPDE